MAEAYEQLAAQRWRVGKKIGASVEAKPKLLDHAGPVLRRVRGWQAKRVLPLRAGGAMDRHSESLCARPLPQGDIGALMAVGDHGLACQDATATPQLVRCPAHKCYHRSCRV